MLTPGAIFLFLAVTAFAYGIYFSDVPAQQIAAFAIAVFFLVLLVFSLVRRTNRPGGK